MSERTPLKKLDKRVSRPKPKAKRVEAYFDSYRQHYWVQDQRTRWMPMNETGMKRILKTRGVSGKIADGELVSDLDLAIVETCLTRGQGCFFFFGSSLAVGIILLGVSVPVVRFVPAGRKA